MLRGTADVKPSRSPAHWSKHTENSLLQLCKLFSANCSMPTAPHSVSKSTVSYSEGNKEPISQLALFQSYKIKMKLKV